MNHWQRWRIKRNTLIDLTNGITLGKSVYETMSARQIAEHFKLHPKGRGRKYWQSVTGWPLLTKPNKSTKPYQHASPEALAVLEKRVENDAVRMCYLMLLKCIANPEQHRRILSEAWDRSVLAKRKYFENKQKKT